MLNIQLPTANTPPELKDVRRLVLYAQTKTGKTEAISKLPNTLIIDTEDNDKLAEYAKVQIIKNAYKK